MLIKLRNKHLLYPELKSFFQNHKGKETLLWVACVGGNKQPMWSYWLEDWLEKAEVFQAVVISVLLSQRVDG